MLIPDGGERNRLGAVPVRCMLRSLWLTALIALIGCGSGSTPPASGSYLNLTGNWQLLAPFSPPGVLPTPISDFMGALQSNGSLVTGTFRAFDPEFPNPCVSFTQDLAVTGTLDTSGNLTLTIPMSGGTATIKTVLGANLQTYTPGTWQIVGGACAMPSTAIEILQVPPLTGTFAGTLTGFGNANVTANVTAVLTQSSTPNADGQFPLTGTVTTTGVCPGTRTLVPEVVTGQAIQPGNAVTIPGASLSGVIVPLPPFSIQGAAVSIYDQNCLTGGLQGSLMKQ